jgi:hypothetical protein
MPIESTSDVSNTATTPVESEPPAETPEPHVVSGAGGIPSEEAFGVPSAEREPLEKVATEFGWQIGFISEPDGGFRWFVFAEDGTLLKHGQADDWDGALLETITDNYPPSGEK